jgi:anaphase-promoting complex subunit 2
VARPIRRYLKEREDTARIIISSLLIDVDDEASSKFSSNSELSYEIASEMAKPFAHTDPTDDDFNWNDINWQPLPHDASPEYKKSKMEDVIYFLLTLWDRDDFINELKNILGDHLLRCQDAEYQKEIRLLELIKVRLGEDKLQACEVMLRDMLESKRINDTIRTTVESSKRKSQVPRTPEGRNTKGLRLRPQTSVPTPTLPPAPTLNAQILSSFFWPVLRDDDFQVPVEILTLQKEYESRFERIKGMRKLRWMNALGESRITLEFEDRTEQFEHLTPWQVSVVYAFQLQPGEDSAGGKGKGKGKTKSEGVTRNIEQLEELLGMDESLIRQAIAFWVGKSVLREISPSTYTVIENLTHNNVDEDAAAAAQELAEVQAAQTSTVKSQADLLNEKKDVYMSFIIGMLTNQGNMGVGRILIMMRMMVQGGFPFAEEEVRGLLVEMEGKGKVVGLGGDVWSIKK